MTNWNGTILGPPHVRLAPTIRLDPPSNLATERPREPHLQLENPLRKQLPRQSSRRHIRLQDQSPLRRLQERKGR